MKNNIPYGKQYIDRADAREIKKSLKNELITTGPYVSKFEKAFCKKIKSKYSVTCSNGTAGLYISLRAINLKKNDVVILPIINFVAASNAAELIGAKIYFADVCPITGQMRPSDLLNCIKKNKLKKIKAVVVMYLGGYPDNLYYFYKLKQRFKFLLIEDACHALGAKFKIKKKYYVGCCKFSDICIFSLHPLKTITSGEGGIVTTNSKTIYRRLIILRNNGIKRSNHINYNIIEASLNFRLSDLNCALGYSQLKKIDKFVKKRKKLFDFYNNNFSKYKIFNFRKLDFSIYPSYHLYIININFKKYKLNKIKLINFLLKNKIYTQQHYILLNKFLAYKKYKKIKFINAKNYFNNSLSLPIYFELSRKKQEYVIKKIVSFIKKNSNY